MQFVVPAQETLDIVLNPAGGDCAVQVAPSTVLRIVELPTAVHCEVETQEIDCIRTPLA